VACEPQLSRLASPHVGGALAERIARASRSSASKLKHELPGCVHAMNENKFSPRRARLHEI
jgi:hypothetical protein